MEETTGSSYFIKSSIYEKELKIAAADGREGEVDKEYDSLFTRKKENPEVEEELKAFRLEIERKFNLCETKAYVMERGTSEKSGVQGENFPQVAKVGHGRQYSQVKILTKTLEKRGERVATIQGRTFDNRLPK